MWVPCAAGGLVGGRPAQSDSDSVSGSPTGLWNEQGPLCPWSGPCEPPGSGGKHLPAPQELTYILPLRQDYNCKSENINYTFIFLWFSFFCFSFHSRINFPVKGTFLMCQIHHCNEQGWQMWEVSRHLGLPQLPAARGNRDFHKDNEALKDGENVAIQLPFCYLVIR